MPYGLRVWQSPFELNGWPRSDVVHATRCAYDIASKLPGGVAFQPWQACLHERNQYVREGDRRQMGYDASKLSSLVVAESSLGVQPLVTEKPRAGILSTTALLTIP